MSEKYYQCSECEAVNLGDGPCPRCKAASELAPARLLDDVPRHRKKSKKKKHAIVLEYTGDTSKMDWLQKMCSGKRISRFETRAAAQQALSDWERGRGIYGSICRPPTWKGHVI